MSRKRMKSSHYCQVEWERAFPGIPSLEATLQQRVGGALGDLLLNLIRDPLDIFCMRLKAATSGITCDEEPISRIIGG